MKIIAHRGASARAPENTLAAARLARELGADGVEVDARVTRDGRLVVLHDADTRRVAPGQRVRRAATSTLAELQALDVGSWKSAAFAGEHAPALDELLAVLGPQQEIFIELKSREFRRIVAELDRLLAPPASRGFPAANAVVMGFNGALIRKIKNTRPAWRVLLLLHRRPSARKFARLLAEVRAGKINGLGQSRAWALPPRDYATWLDAGGILSVWTVDDPAEARAWRERGFDYLTSNCPEKMRGAK